MYTTKCCRLKKDKEIPSKSFPVKPLGTFLNSNLMTEVNVSQKFYDNYERKH